MFLDFCQHFLFASRKRLLHPEEASASPKKFFGIPKKSGTREERERERGEREREREGGGERETEREKGGEREREREREKGGGKGGERERGRREEREREGGERERERGKVRGERGGERGKKGKEEKERKREEKKEKNGKKIEKREKGKKGKKEKGKEERADRNRSPSTIARTGTFCNSRAWKPFTPTDALQHASSHSSRTRFFEQKWRFSRWRWLLHLFQWSGYFVHDNSTQIVDAEKPSLRRFCWHCNKCLLLRPSLCILGIPDLASSPLCLFGAPEHVTSLSVPPIVPPCTSTTLQDQDYQLYHHLDVGCFPLRAVMVVPLRPSAWESLQLDWEVR